MWPTARNYAVARLIADVGLRINEARMLDLDDVRWELGRFGKLNVRHGKGSRRKGWQRGIGATRARAPPASRHLADLRFRGKLETCRDREAVCGPHLAPLLEAV